MQNVLTALKDIPGVVGSFVLNRTGGLVSREMPAVYPDSVYPEIGRRLLSVHEAIESQVTGVSECVLKFDSYWFVCRRTPECLLGVLTTDTVNHPALRMAANVALKQIGEQVDSLPVMAAAQPSAAAVTPPQPAPQQPQEKAAPAKGRRFWRGQYVD